MKTSSRNIAHNGFFHRMGWSTSAIVGASIAAGNKPALALLGDGSFLMGGTAVATAVEQNLPVTWVVLNNRSLSVQELIQYAKSRPGQLSFASPGAGTGSHIAGMFFGRSIGAGLIHVPYQGGGDAIVALIGGHVPLSLGAVSTALPHMKSGKLRALGVTEAKRLSIAPDVPTIAESGLPGFEVSQWYGVFAPAGTPAAIVRKMDGDLAAIMVQPDTRGRLSGQGLEVAYRSAGAFGPYVRSELAKWTKLLQEMGIQGQ